MPNDETEQLTHDLLLSVVPDTHELLSVTDHPFPPEMMMHGFTLVALKPKDSNDVNTVTTLGLVIHDYNVANVKLFHYEHHLFFTLSDPNLLQKLKAGVVELLRRPWTEILSTHD